MRAYLSIPLVILFLSACADDTPAAMAGTDDTGASTGTPGMTTNPMTTAPATDGMTMGGTADGTDATDATMGDPSTGPDPDDSSTGTPATGSTSDGMETSSGGMMESSSGGMETSSGGMMESSSGGMETSSGGMMESSSGDGGMTTGTSSDGGMMTGTSSDGGMMTGTSSDGGAMTSSTGGSGGGECITILCGNAMTPAECGDCVDNDGDAAIDGIDVECINPCDDDEDSFATGIPGDNIDLCHQDCFFDGNSGAGDDGCDWWLACDPLDPDMGECSIPGGQTCPADQTQQCIDTCQVPNGCDCFGCCTVNVDGTDYNILIGADGCSLDNFAACPECTQVPACTDPCDPTDCELCFGETELPPGCKTPTCPDGQQVCEVNTDCPADYFCQTGCCELIPV